MSELTFSAKIIIQQAMKRMGNPYEVARFYGIGIQLVKAYLNGEELGSLTARQVMRVEMGRLAARKKGDFGWKPGEKDRYKGGKTDKIKGKHVSVIVFDEYEGG